MCIAKDIDIIWAHVTMTWRYLLCTTKKLLKFHQTFSSWEGGVWGRDYISYSPVTSVIMCRLSYLTPSPTMLYLTFHWKFGDAYIMCGVCVSLGCSQMRSGKSHTIALSNLLQYLHNAIDLYLVLGRMCVTLPLHSLPQVVVILPTNCKDRYDAVKKLLCWICRSVAIFVHVH